jgi:hypothetical protein
MKTSTIVEPFSGDFTREDLLKADRIARENPRQISDTQLSYLAAYDRGFAEETLAKREALKQTAAAPPAAALNTRQHDAQPATMADVSAALRSTVKGIAAPIKDYVATQIAPLMRRLEHVEARLAEQEQENARVAASLAAKRYRGVWSAVPGDPYVIGNEVTHRGSTWHCDVNYTTSKPGDNGSGWTMMTKAGRDGRDAVNQQ